jgi:quercetin dioxygenase-like cupin family protein
MTMTIRRIVTGHDDTGKAIVTIDRPFEKINVMRSGNSAATLWITDDMPAEVDGDADPAERDIDIEPPARGTVFRILELVPGKAPYMHRTDTVDYVVVLNGECVMLLDDGEEVALKAGDVMIQRATWHGWTNRTDTPCRIAFVLTGAKAPKTHLHHDH